MPGPDPRLTKSKFVGVEPGYQTLKISVIILIEHILKYMLQLNIQVQCSKANYLGFNWASSLTNSVTPHPLFSLSVP